MQTVRSMNFEVHRVTENRRCELRIECWGECCIWTVDERDKFQTQLDGFKFLHCHQAGRTWQEQYFLIHNVTKHNMSLQDSRGESSVMANASSRLDAQISYQAEPRRELPWWYFFSSCPRERGFSALRACCHHASSNLNLPFFDAGLRKDYLIGFGIWMVTGLVIVESNPSRTWAWADRWKYVYNVFLMSLAQKIETTSNQIRSFVTLLIPQGRCSHWTFIRQRESLVARRLRNQRHLP